MNNSERALDWMREGESYEKKHKVSAALRAFEHAARSSDTAIAAEANYHIGLLREQQHHTTEAVRAFREAARSGLRETKASAYYHLGRIYEHKHWLSDAYATYQHSARLGARPAQDALARLWPEEI